MNKNLKISLLCLTALFFFLHPSLKVQADDDDYDLKKLMALPYLAGYFRAPEKTNVTQYNRRFAHQGYNLYSSGHAAAAYLIDMKGNVLHEWVYPIERIWPEEITQGTTPFWEDVYLLENGELLAIYHDGGIIKLDKDSNLLWSYKVKTHHAISLDESGNIYTLTEETLRLKEDVEILDNSILILSPDGKPTKKISLFHLMRKSQNATIQSIFKRVLGIALNGGEDVFHTNTLEVFDGKAKHKNSVVFKKGNIMLCMLTLSSVVIVDLQLEDIVWALGPRIWFQGQHDPDLLDNGNILIFDNHLNASKTQSRVMEFEPLTQEIVWEYREEKFYTDTHGTNERLPNRNTLIVETNTGRAFEVTPDKQIAWEFFNPHTTGKTKDLIAAIFVMYRINPDYVVTWLK